VLVAEGEGRKDEATGRLSGRAADNRLVHFAVNAGVPDAAAAAAGNTADVPRPGDMASVQVTYGAPHHLVADGPFCVTRRTAAGDAWERRQSEVGCGPVGGAGASSDVGPIVLGLPTVGATPVL
jgi:tRNA-2-methylthio-N6-dimethylallyladenosine synthase